MPFLQRASLRDNKLPGFFNLSGRNTPRLVFLDAENNPTRINSFYSLSSCSLLHEIIVTPLTGLSLRDIRTQALGEYMSRGDEVTCAVGQNIFEDEFQNNITFDLQEFLKYKREAAETMI